MLTYICVCVCVYMHEENCFGSYQKPLLLDQETFKKAKETKKGKEKRYQYQSSQAVFCFTSTPIKQVTAHTHTQFRLSIVRIWQSELKQCFEVQYKTRQDNTLQYNTIHTHTHTHTHVSTRPRKHATHNYPHTHTHTPTCMTWFEAFAPVPHRLNNTPNSSDSTTTQSAS